MLLSVVAFKLLTPLTIPFTWDPTLRADPASPYHSTIPLGVSIPLLLVSCALSISTPFIIRGCSKSESGNRQTLSGTTRKKVKSNPLWAELAYLFITLGQIFLAADYVYTADFSSIALFGTTSSSGRIDPSATVVPSSTDANFLDQISLNWLLVLYGTLQIVHVFYAIASGRVRVTKRSRMRGELELPLDDEEVNEIEIVDGYAMRERIGRRSRDAFEDVDLGEQRFACELRVPPP